MGICHTKMNTQPANRPPCGFSHATTVEFQNPPFEDTVSPPRDPSVVASTERSRTSEANSVVANSKAKTPSRPSPRIPNSPRKEFPSFSTQPSLAAVAERIVYLEGVQLNIFKSESKPESKAPQCDAGDASKPADVTPAAACVGPEPCAPPVLPRSATAPAGSRQLGPTAPQRRGSGRSAESYIRKMKRLRKKRKVELCDQRSELASKMFSVVSTPLAWKRMVSKGRKERKARKPKGLKGTEALPLSSKIEPEEPKVVAACDPESNWFSLADYEAQREKEEARDRAEKPGYLKTTKKTLSRKASVKESVKVALQRKASLVRMQKILQETVKSVIRRSPRKTKKRSPRKTKKRVAWTKVPKLA